MWVAVRQRFQQFRGTLDPTLEERNDARIKYVGVTNCLSNFYYGEVKPELRLLVGSWGKETIARPSQDIDIYFVLPSEEFRRFDNYAGNGQSALLQEARSALLGSYPQSTIRGDGQVVVVEFNSLRVEVAPSFLRPDGQFVLPNANDGGHWIVADPNAERAAIDYWDQIKRQNPRNVLRMLKVWKRHHDVTIKSFHLELLVLEFFASYQHGIHDFFWYDWFFRDFFIFLQSKANSWVYAPGTDEAMNVGDSWLNKADNARRHAISACEYEFLDMVRPAGQQWQAIFGNSIPVEP